MKKFVSLILISVIACGCVGMTACDQVKQIPGGDNVVSAVEGAGAWAADGFNNIKDSALNKINGDIDNFMKEHNIPADKKDEVLKLAKEWAKTALTASGEIDKTKGSLKQYLSDHLDDLEVSDVSDASSQASKNKK